MRKTLLALLLCATPAQAQFRVPPYLQNPDQHSMSVLWIGADNQPGRLRCNGREWSSRPVPARALAEGLFQHEVRVDGLRPGQAYDYQVEQGSQLFQGRLRTAPERDSSIRFVAYSDSETQPESTGARVAWDDPEGKPGRLYLTDQTDGYAANLRMIRERKPDFVVIAGDLVEAGGLQQDWDEFWKHNTSPRAAESLASQIPIWGVLGNHEYWAGPKTGRYSSASEGAVAKFLTYFRAPDNGASDPLQKGRYYRVDYGPITLIALDGCNGLPDNSERDSNHHLASKDSHAPDFNPGSEQYRWLESQLKDAQQRSVFTFVAFHHCPYSSGPHGVPAGQGKGRDPQSGVPLRVLTPLFLKYGVDVLLNGHDETFERSLIDGEEVMPDGTTRPHSLQIYDVGIGGDGLRGPQAGVENPFQQFIAHRNSSEVWEDGVLREGGKHYGHLEVEVHRDGDAWKAVLTPVYVFPVMDKPGGPVVRWERRIYEDVVELSRRAARF